MKLLHKYILSEIIRIFFVILFGIIIVVMISNFLDEISMLVRHKPSFSLILNYFLYKTPFATAQSVPFAFLLSILFVFSQLNKYSELTAIKASGIGFYSIMAPVLALALFVSIFSIIMNETLVSKSFDRAKYIKETLIQKKDTGANRVQKDLAKLSSGGRIFYIRHFDGLLGVMKGICILRLDKNFRLTERLDAVEGKWSGDKWLLKDISIRKFSGNTTETDVAIKKFHQLYIKDTPEDFIVRQRSPEDTLTVNIFRLRKLIKLLKESGFKYQEEAVNFHLKLAFPFATFILALLGVSIPFLFSTTRSVINVMLGFVFTFITAFFYLGFVTIGMSAGNAGVLPPALSAWIANVVFIFIGFFLLSKVKK